MRHQIAWKPDNRIDENCHPNRLRQDDPGEEQCFRCDIGDRAQPGEFFLLENQPFPRNFARRIVASHQREKNDLEHDKPRNERTDANLFRPLGRVGGELEPEIFGRILRQTFQRRQSIERKNDDEGGKAEEQCDLQRELAAVAKE